MSIHVDEAARVGDQQGDRGGRDDARRDQPIFAQALRVHRDRHGQKPEDCPLLGQDRGDREHRRPTVALLKRREHRSREKCGAEDFLGMAVRDGLQGDRIHDDQRERPPREVTWHAAPQCCAREEDPEHPRSEHAREDAEPVRVLVEIPRAAAAGDQR